MKNRGWFIIGFVIIAGPSYSAVLDTIEAVVNGELILSGEVDNQLRINMRNVDLETLNGSDLELLRQKMLQKMIDAMLFMQEAKKNLSPDQKEQISQRVATFTDQEIEQYKKEHNLTTPEAIAQEEKRLRLPWEEFRRIQYLINENNYLVSFVVPQLSPEKPTPPTLEEIQKFQKENPDVKPSDQILVFHILLRVPPGAGPDQEKNILEQIRQIAARARSGESFEQLVQKYSEYEPTRSQGGRLAFKKGDLDKEFDQVFDMNIDEVSNPIRTSLGYHIFKVMQKETLADLLLRQKREQANREWLKELRKKAKIDIRQGKELKPYVP